MAAGGLEHGVHRKKKKSVPGPQWRKRHIGKELSQPGSGRTETGAVTPKVQTKAT
jgi:hypothetical protein